MNKLGVVVVTFRLGVVAVLVLEFLVESLPLLVEGLPVLVVLLHREHLLLLLVHPECLLEGERVDLFEDCFQGDETLLEDPK